MEPKLKKLFTVSVTVDPPIVVGQDDKVGRRQLIPITGGTVEGEGYHGVVLPGGVDSQIIAKWLQTSALNFPMALCWQVFFAGPFVRFLFRRIFPEKEENTAEN